MTKRPLSEALGVKEQVMAVPNEMIRIAMTTGRVGVSMSKRNKNTITTTGVNDLSIWMKPTSSSRYTQFPVARVPVEWISDRNERELWSIDR